MPGSPPLPFPGLPSPGLPVLVLDASGDGCLAALVGAGATLAERRHEGGRGSAAVLPALVEAVLAEAGLGFDGIGALVAAVGPGSFTGVRAALALAHGIALATGLPLRGVLATAAIRVACAGAGPLPVWVATGSRRGRVFLDTGEAVLSLAVDAVPQPSGPIGLAGDAAGLLLPALGGLATVLPVTRATAAGLAGASGVAPVPFYVDPPEARPNPVRRPVPA